VFDPYWDAAASPPGYTASVRAPRGDGAQKYFDDNAWVGLALVQRYRLTGDAAALARAQEVFAFDVSGWDDDLTHPAPGGVWWAQALPNSRFRHRNTISTSASAELALQLYDVTGQADPFLLEWGRRMYDWVDTYLRGPNGLYGDHVDLAGVVDGGQLSYNQGTMIGSAVMLSRFTGDPSYLARARDIANTALQTWQPGGFSQAPGYNAVFFRNLLLLQAATGDSRYRDAMEAYGDTVWDTLRDPTTGLFAFRYGRFRSADSFRLLDQASMLQVYAGLALEPGAYLSLT
jgi:uncharacterized protein YyaL (SSP411 family)